jgi:NAD(P)H-hydrate epimerase
VTLLPLPEADWGTIGPEAAEELLKRLPGYRALLIGPGLGAEDPTQLFLQRVLGLEQPKARGRVGFFARSSEAKPAEESRAAPPDLPPTVLDADGLNLLAKIDDWPEHLPRGRFIFTPHPDSDRVQAAVDAATRWGQVVVLKGATTVVAGPDGRSAVHAGGNPALATAGTGDVLAGVIASLLAQGLELYPAALLGVYLHAAAGELVREELGDAGALASDLLPRLPRVIKALR